MDDHDRRVPEEPVLVDVEFEGRWWPGTLREWAKWDARGWLALCTWTVAPGSTFLRWVTADRVRERE